MPRAAVVPIVETPIVTVSIPARSTQWTPGDDSARDKAKLVAERLVLLVQHADVRAPALVHIHGHTCTGKTVWINSVMPLFPSSVIVSPPIESREPFPTVDELCALAGQYRVLFLDCADFYMIGRACPQEFSVLRPVWDAVQAAGGTLCLTTMEQEDLSPWLLAGVRPDLTIHFEPERKRMFPFRQAPTAPGRPARSAAETAEGAWPFLSCAQRHAEW